MRPDIITVTAGFTGIPEAITEAFLIAKNGAFLLRRLAIAGFLFLEAIVRTGEGFRAEGMEDFAGEGVHLHAPRIPRVQILEVESFFRQVHAMHQAEAICLLYFSPSEGGRWRFVAPDQTVSGGHLSWVSPGAAPPGWYLAGSFHSHGSISAFHSGTDDRDELGWDGLHVTVGGFPRPEPEYAASIVMAGHRSEVGIEALMEVPPPVAFPASWLERVSKFVPPPVRQFGALGGDDDDPVAFRGGQVVTRLATPTPKGGGNGRKK